MRVFTEKTEKFSVCGVKTAAGPNTREEMRSAFLGKDEGARFECLLGCGEGFYGVLRRVGPIDSVKRKGRESAFLCEETYLYGKRVFPTVYMPAGGTQWVIPAGTYLKAVFSEKETRALGIEGAWKFLEEIYIPSRHYIRDEANPFRIEYYSGSELQLWVPVI